ncbi:hypothetical protein FNF27_06195 [Cafeteria roenbergensis]|uniref:UBC core domain-containing protein n=1 Tax=Cafeteria roenbergensis TaxID=33653 RepID=A0A5A8E4E4_CAFRO|nr:hypothetical protein FNF27_06195 [Cafeteria roenbergensis]
MVKEANLIDSICFYWFAYLFANLIWVFVPIPLIWKATADICRGEVKTCLPWVNPDGSVEDEFLVERLAEGDEGDEVDDEEDPFFDEDDELEADEGGAQEDPLIAAAPPRRRNHSARREPARGPGDMADAPVPRTPMAARAKPADEPMSSAKKLLSSVRMKQMAGVNLPHLRTVTIPTRAVLAQYKEIQHSMPSGMFVIPDETRFRVWHGVLFVPPGVTFAHHVITFTLTIADNFPAEGAAPTIVFQQWPPHPLVQPGTGLFALEHFIPLWTVQMPLSLALKAVKRAFVPTGRDLERMCFSTSTLDPRTAEGMSKDLEGMLAMVEGLAKKSHTRTS